MWRLVHLNLNRHLLCIIAVDKPHLSFLILQVSQQLQIFEIQGKFSMFNNSSFCNKKIHIPFV